MNILFIFNFGSELRQFVYSGLLDALIDEQHSVFVSSKITSKKFLGLLPEKVAILPYYREQHSILYSIINIALNETNKSEFKFGPFIHKRGKLISALFYSSIRLFVKICNNRRIRPFFVWIEQLLAEWNHSKEWLILLKEYKIDAIVINVPNMNVSCMSAAKKLKIRRLLIFHTNKDILAADRFIVPYTKYGVWNYHMREVLHSKFYTPLPNIELTGCLHFHYLMQGFQTGASMPNELLGVEAQKIVLTYICGALNVENETELFERFLFCVKTVFGNNYHVILRKNPMETRDIWEKYEDNHVKIHKPKWYYSQKENINYALREDLVEFASIVKKSDAILGLPSTVVIETSLCEKDFYNLLFDECVTISTTNSHASSLWELPIYSNVRKFKVAIPIRNDDELLKAFTALKERRNSTDKEKYDKFLKSEITYSDYHKTLESHIRLITSQQ